MKGREDQQKTPGGIVLGHWADGINIYCSTKGYRGAVWGSSCSYICDTLDIRLKGSNVQPDTKSGV